MNDIIFAGKRIVYGETFNKATEIIAPYSSGSLIYGGKILSYSRERIIVIPPLIKYELAEPNDEDIHVLTERTLVNIKEILIISDVENGGIRHAAGQAEYFYGSDSPQKQLVLSALGDLIAGYINYSADNSRRSPVTDIVLSEIEKGITQSLFSLEDCIKKLPLNYDYVRKLFKKEVGLTPHEYLLKCRMELAAKIILGNISNRYSNYTVSQIAEACGYADPLYFSRSFKKYYGVSPSEYPLQTRKEQI